MQPVTRITSAAKQPSDNTQRPPGGSSKLPQSSRVVLTRSLGQKPSPVKQLEPQPCIKSINESYNEPSQVKVASVEQSTSDNEGKDVNELATVDYVEDGLSMKEASPNQDTHITRRLPHAQASANNALRRQLVVDRLKEVQSAPRKPQRPDLANDTPVKGRLRLAGPSRMPPKSSSQPALAMPSIATKPLGVVQPHTPIPKPPRPLPSSAHTARRIPASASKSTNRPDHPLRSSSPSKNSFSSTSKPASSTSTGRLRAPLKATNANPQTPVKPSTKPAFTTYQRSFTPSASLPQPSPSKSSQTTPDTIRAQTHLLHLSLLAKSAESTLSAWTKSAYENLHSVHNDLQLLYTALLPLERQARQQENLLTLHDWTKGNVKSAGRRVSVLCAVVSEIMSLTAPGKNLSYGEEDNVRSQNSVEESEGIEEEQGDYARLVHAFTQWADWVQEIWHQRHHDTDMEEEVDNEVEATAAQNITPVSGLGDSLKQLLRHLIDTLNCVHLRLDELPPFAPTAADRPLPTPIKVHELTRALVAGMKEELQLIREIEFEVVVGEEAWMRQRLGALAGEVERGFGTPRGG